MNATDTTFRSRSAAREKPITARAQSGARYRRGGCGRGGDPRGRLRLHRFVPGSRARDSFTGGPDGRLTAAPGSPFPAQGLGPLGSEFRPTNSDQLFVSNAHNAAVNSGTVSAFTDSPNGTLSPVTGSPFADGQMAPCWVEISYDGQSLFTVNAASGTISRYSIAPAGALTLLGSTTVSASGAVGAVDARLSRDGRFLYVDESKIGAVGEFAVDGGDLTELAGSPVSLPASATPAGIIAN